MLLRVMFQIDYSILHSVVACAVYIIASRVVVVVGNMVWAMLASQPVGGFGLHAMGDWVAGLP